MDAQHNVRYLTDTTGAVTDQYTYDAFGNLISSSGTTPNTYRFAGEHLDANLGLYYLRARYYNPSVGRFWNRDSAEITPDDPRELNRYVYVAANPVNATDPTGYGFLELGETNVQIRARAYAALAAAGGYVGTLLGEAEGIEEAIESKAIESAIRFEMRQDGVGGAMKALTVARTTVLDAANEAQVIVRVNGGRWSESARAAIERVLDTLRSAGADAEIAEGTQHAERAVYEAAVKLNDNIFAIGISNGQGPCGAEDANCDGFFEAAQVTVYYLKQLVRVKSF